jgi:hypothetical protein
MKTSKVAPSADNAMQEMHWKERETDVGISKCGSGKKLKTLEEWTRLDDFFVIAGKVPSHDARIDAGADDLP